MNPLATKSHNRDTVPFNGGQYVASLMAELSRVGIAQRIQQAREQAGIRQRELAEGLHVHVNTVQNWESQKKPITPWDRLEEIASWTGVSRDWLIHGEHQGMEPEAALQMRFSDAILGLEESQEDIHEKLDHALTLLEQLADELSKAPSRPQAPDTDQPESFRARSR